MLGDALRYPLASEDRVSTLVIGGVLLAVPLLAALLPVLLGPLGLVAVVVTLPVSVVVQGYLVRVLRSAATGEPAAPSFTDWGTLFVDGLKLLAVSLVYSLVVLVPTIALVVVGVGTFTVSGGTEGATPPTPNAALSAGVLLAFLAVTLLSVALSYVLPAALTNFALRDSLGAAFDLGTIRQVAFTSDYLVGVLLGYVVGGVLATLALGFSVVLVGIPALFYAQVVTYYCFGRGFADARASMGVANERVA